ncbi:MAG: molybdenum cofactor guanylyltransferase [Alphaproteobacteria bacterium]|nr:molybdenum cofactor guanylyltransferase [Alphaproteobacteria bacterium]
MEPYQISPPSLGSCAAILLAGGRGSRLGGNKAGAVFRGQTLLASGLQRLVELPLPTERTAVSLGENHDSLRQGELSDWQTPVLRDRQLDCGPLGGIATGLAWASQIGCDWLYCFPLDMPLLPPDCLTRLIAAARDDYPIIRAASPGRSFPTVALIATRLHEQLVTYLADGGRRAFEFQNSHQTITAQILNETEARNINRPDDLLG